MELKEPHAKSRSNFNSQPAFPIFIESEIGVSIDNWVPIVCTGVFQGKSVVVNSPAEISALYSMGNFGKGSNSRSTPYIVRNHPKLPRFMRKRQYEQRKKWIDGKFDINDRIEKQKNTNVILELHSVFAQLIEKNLIHKSDSESSNLNKNEVIDVLSSDEEVMLNISDETKGKGNEKDESEMNAIDLEFPDKSVVVLPDSDNEKDDYFKDLKPKLCIDNSELYESLVLSLEEAYFLAYGLGCLQIIDDNRKMLTLEESWAAFCNVQDNFCVRYAVYHYFRSKGWIVKPAIKFGGDFLLYKKGQSFYHANYVVIIRVCDNSDSSDTFNWLTIQNHVRLSATAGKEILIANIMVSNDISIRDLKDSPDLIKHIKINETLLRRWTTGQKQKDEEN